MLTRGWSYFLVGLLLSSFLGGGVRVFFSAARIRGWVEELVERRQPKFTLEFEEARLTFADGWMPGLAVEFKNLQVGARDTCITGSSIHLQRLNVPVQASALFTQQVRFGEIHADEVLYHYRAPECDSKLRIPREVKEAKEKPLVGQIENFVRDRWRNEMENTSALLDGVEVNNLAIQVGDEPLPRFTLPSLSGRIDSQTAEGQIDFILRLGVGLVGHEPFGDIKGQLRVSPDAVRLQARGNLKEGQYSTRIHWDVLEGQWSTDSDLRDLPAHHFLSLLGQWNLLRWPGLAPKHQWFRCRVKSSANASAWQDTLFQYEGCGFYGELGDIFIRAGEARILAGQLFPLKADFRQVAMGPILVELGAFRKWVSQEGTLDGVLHMGGLEDLQFEGLWSSFQFQVPEWGPFKPVGLPIDRIQVLWDFQKNFWSFSVKNPTAYGQDIDLNLGFKKVASSLSPNGPEDESLDISWHVVMRDWPKVMLRLGRELSGAGVETKGSIQISEDKPMSLTSEISADSLKWQGLEFEYPKLQASYQKGRGYFSGQMKAFEVLGDSPWKFFLAAKKVVWANGPSAKTESDLDTAGGEDAKEKWPAWTEVRLKGEFDGEGRWVANPAQASLGSKNPVEFVGRGFFRAIDQGILKSRSGRQRRSWDVFGRLDEPRFE